MARTSSRKTKRARTSQGRAAGPQFRVASPISGAAAGRAGAEAAFGLADALNNLMPLAEKAEDRTRQKAAADVATGQVDEDNSSWIYRNNVNALRARANWARDQSEFDQHFKNLDVDNMSADQFDATVDELYQKKYGGLDDEGIAKELLPKLEAYRKEKFKEVLERQAVNELQANNSDITAVAEAALKEAHEDGETFQQEDYYGLHKQIADVNIGRRGEINDLYFEVIKDLAIRNADPDLIRNLPRQWEDGTPTFVEIPSFNEKVLNAELRAQAALVAEQKKEAKLKADAQDSALDAVLMQATSAAMGGNQALAIQIMDAYTGMEGADPKDAMTFTKGIPTIINAGDKFEVDLAGLAQLSGRVYSGNSSSQELITEWINGTMGGGIQSVSELQQLLQVQKTIRDDPNKVFSTKEFGLYMGNLKSQYNPQRDPLKIVNSTLVGVLNDARSTYFEKVEKGMKPSKAYHEVREEFDKRAENAGVFASDGSLSPMQAARGFLDSTSGVTSTRLKESASPMQLKELKDNGSITRDEWRSLMLLYTVAPQQ